MKTLICSNVFGDFAEVSNLTSPINSNYATINGYDYLLDDQKRCENDSKSFWWEKIAFIRETLHTRDGNDLVIWLDVDSIIKPEANINEILLPSQDFGMVPIYAGMNGLEKQDWYNAGVIALRNTEAARNLIEAIWTRRNQDKDDEIALIAELPNSEVNFCELNPKWNCWHNNKHLVTTPSITTFHGIYPASAKVTAIQAYLK